MRCQATINDDDRPGHVGGLVGRQEGDDVGDLVGPAETLEHSRLESGPKFGVGILHAFDEAIEERRAHRPGRHTVDPDAVSRVVNESGCVSQKTRKKVAEAIRKTGYRVNQTAVGLRTGKTNSIGVILSDISNPFFPFIIKGIDHVCSQNNYDTILFNTGERIEKELRYIDLLKQKYVKGVIISSCIPDYQKNKKIFSDLTPVFFNRKPKGIQADFVLNDVGYAGIGAKRLQDLVPLEAEERKRHAGRPAG